MVLIYHTNSKRNDWNETKQIEKQNTKTIILIIEYLKSANQQWYITKKYRTKTCGYLKIIRQYSFPYCDWRWRLVSTMDYSWNEIKKQSNNDNNRDIIVQCNEIIRDDLPLVSQPPFVSHARVSRSVHQYCNPPDPATNVRCLSTSLARARRHEAPSHWTTSTTPWWFLPTTSSSRLKRNQNPQNTNTSKPRTIETEGNRPVVNPPSCRRCVGEHRPLRMWFVLVSTNLQSLDWN